MQYWPWLGATNCTAFEVGQHGCDAAATMPYRRVGQNQS